MMLYVFSTAIDYRCPFVRLKLMSEETPQSALDRRTAARVGFGAQVAVCEFSSREELPEAADYRAVTASDLSQTGISFATTSWPASDSLIVAFGEEAPRRVVARVVNIRSEGQAAQDRRFDVSCEFTEWLPANA